MKFAVLGILTTLALSADQIPPFFVDAVAALGRLEAKVPGQAPEWVTEASGFLYGYLVKNDPDPAKRSYEAYLVTNRHVLVNHSSILARFDPEKPGEQVKEFPLTLKDEKARTSGSRWQTRRLIFQWCN